MATTTIRVARDPATRQYRVRAEGDGRIDHAYKRAGYVRTVLSSGYDTEAEARAEGDSLASWMRAHRWGAVEVLS